MAMTKNANLYNICDKPILEGDCFTPLAAIFDSYTGKWHAIPS